MPATEDGLRDRARGALLGLAIGDALGTSLEFKARDSYVPLTGIVGGGPFRLKAGEWTDDTAMALALASSLLEKDGLDPLDLMQRFAAWAERGNYSCNGRCFDIGNTVRGALDRFRRTGNPLAGSKDPRSAGNGALMRLAPVPIRYAFDPEARRAAARLQSETTHGADEAVAACEAFGDLVAEAIAGTTKEDLLVPRDEPWPPKVTRALRMQSLSRSRAEIRAGGYVIESLEASLWAVGKAQSFVEAVLLAANLGEDADTTAAITGQLAGSLWGASAIPEDWLKLLAWREKITTLADRLHDRSLITRTAA